MYIFVTYSFVLVNLQEIYIILNLWCVLLIASRYFYGSRNSTLHIDRGGANVSILVKAFYDGRLGPPLLHANMQFPYITLRYKNVHLLFVNAAFLRGISSPEKHTSDVWIAAT